ncbi:MAG: HlyD family secretion protein [Xenococcaceae cyanobacterium]
MVRGFSSKVFTPVNSEELLPTVSPLIIAGGLLMVGTLGVALNLARVIKYNVTVRSAAIVRPTGDIRIVQTAGEGTIEQISVKGNQFVKKGEPIAIIDDSQLQTQKNQLQDRIQQNQKQYDNLVVQTVQLDKQIDYERLSIEQAIAIASDDLDRVERIYQNQQVATKADVEEVEAELSFAKEALNRYQQLAETGAIAGLQIEEKRQAYKTALARKKKAQTELNPSAATVAIAEGKIIQEREKGRAALVALKKQREELVRSQFEIVKQIGSDRREMQQLEARLQKTIIRAPVSGTILDLKLRNPGQVVSLGNAIASIAPDNAPLIVKAKVNTEDIGKVSVCQAQTRSGCTEGRVNMRVSAYPYPDYGILKGSVKAISADTITPQVNSATTSNPYYEVTIEPDKLVLERNGRDYFIQPGMEITADIISRQETALEFILRKAKLMSDY